MTLNYVALTITVQDAGEDAGTGSVLVAPTGAVTAAGVTVVSTVPVSRSLSSGAVTVNLVATDNAGTTPAAGFWAYNITLPGGQPQTYLVEYANGASQRFDDLTPVVAETTYGPAAATSGVTSFNTRTGAVTPASGDYSSFYDAAGAATAAQSNAETFATSAVATETTRAETAEALALPKAGGTMTGWLGPAVVVLTDTATIAVNAALGNDFRVTLGGNRTIAAPTNPVDGQDITFLITQPASGGPYTPTFASGTGGYSYGSGSAPTWSTAASATDMIAFKYRAAASKWLCLGSATGF
jgi:hypothetical protein